MPRSARASVGIYMRTGKADKSSHATPFGRTGKKGRKTCVTGYCARCKSCLLFNKKKHSTILYHFFELKRYSDIIHTSIDRSFVKILSLTEMDLISHTSLNRVFGHRFFFSGVSFDANWKMVHTEYTHA